MKTAIISTIFPSSGGVATYTKYLFDELKKIDKEVIVSADKLEKTPNEDKDIIRCWNHSPRYVYQIDKEIIKRKIKKAHFQQEFHLYGNKITAFILPFNMLLLRLLGKEVIITLHGVVPLKEVDKEFLKENGYSGSPFIIKWGLKILYSFLCLSANKVIVHERKFKDYLEDYYVNPNKLYVVNHGIKSLNKLIDKEKAKKILGIKNKKYTFVYFGYVTGYKGIELLIDALKKIKEDNFNLIVMGSKHPRLKEEKFYKDYYDNIKSFFKKDKRCIFVDYAKEDEVNYYFRAADCGVFPYKVQIASSGPMSLAIANEILVIASDAFEGVLPEQLIFKQSTDSLMQKLREAKSGKLNKNLMAIKEIKDRSSWNNIAKKTMEVWRA